MQNGGAEGKKNLWQSFLKEVSSRSGPEDSYLIMLGRVVGRRQPGEREA